MKHFSKLYIGLIMLFLFAPLLVIIIYSFNASNSTAVFTGFSLQWYKELMRDTELISALKNSVILAILSSVIATVIGTAAAVGIHAYRRKWTRTAAMTVTNIPMMNPDIVTGISMMLLFVFVGVIVGTANSLNFFTLLIAHITFNIPYVLLSVMPKLKQTDHYLLEAAEDLGCTRVKSFFKVILPSISSGISTGFVMAFTLSLDDFVISHFTSGSDFQTLPILIYSMTKKRVRLDIYALSSVIFLAVLLVLVLNNLAQTDDENTTAKKKKSQIILPKICRIISVTLVVVLSASVVFISRYSSNSLGSGLDLRGTYTRDFAGTELNIFNWGEYISNGYDDTLDVNSEFEKLTGIKINYTTYESNESMYSKLKGGGVSYDIIIPSDYMIERLKVEGMLKKIDTSKLSNYKYIDEKYKNLYFDKDNEYSVPYSVGMVGIIYNKKCITKEEASTWNVLWNEKFKEGGILNFNNPRDAFATAQLLCGIDINTTDRTELDTAAEKLKEQKKVLQSYVMDEIFDKLESEEAILAPYYAGDFLTMYENNENLGLAYPKEGTNVFVDSVCIPSCTQNYEAALMYINFLLDPKIALANAEYICYATPNTEVVNMEEYTYCGDEILYPSEEDCPEATYYYNLDNETRRYMDKLWEEVKLSKSS